MSSKRAIIMHPLDNVATVVEEVQPGDEIAAILVKEVNTLEAVEKIPFGFKVALSEIAQGEIVRKYGEAIGKATTAIARGTVVHVHNLEGIRARGDLAERSER